MFNFLKNNEDESSNLLPPPVRRLVFGEKKEEEELKNLVSDFYDQLERLEEAHDSHYEKLELEVDGSGRDSEEVAKVKLKKKSGEKPTTRSGGFGRTRKNKKDTNYDLLDRSFTLTELMNDNRKYLIDTVEQDIEDHEGIPQHSTTIEVEEGGTPDRDELAEMDEKPDSQANFESPLKGSSDDSSSDMKENILDHTS